MLQRTMSAAMLRCTNAFLIQQSPRVRGSRISNRRCASKGSAAIATTARPEVTICPRTSRPISSPGCRKDGCCWNKLGTFFYSEDSYIEKCSGFCGRGGPAVAAASMSQECRGHHRQQHPRERSSLRRNRPEDAMHDQGIALGLSARFSGLRR